MGIVATCNAGAAANPTPELPRRPSKPGTTQHHGSGKKPLNGRNKRSNSNRFVIQPSLRALPLLVIGQVSFRVLSVYDAQQRSLRRGDEHTRNLGVVEPLYEAPQPGVGAGRRGARLHRFVDRFAAIAGQRLPAQPAEDDPIIGGNDADIVSRLAV